MQGRGVLKPWLRAGALLAVELALLTLGHARADVRITETGAETLAIEAHDATLRDVLDALAKAHKIQFASKDPLSKSVAGTYSGTLQRVLFRLLDGYNAVLRVSPAGMKLTVIGLASATPVPTPVIAFARPIHPAVSSNVDLDEEKAMERAGAAPLPPRAGAAPPMPVSQAIPSHPAVSSNVDLDEELSVQGRGRRR